MTTDPIDSGIVDWIWDGRLAAEGYSAAELNTLARVLVRECPHCKAEPGSYCRTNAGKEIRSMDGQHVSRRLRNAAPMGGDR